MTLIFGLVFVYLALLAFLFFQQRSMMYFPGGPRPPALHFDAPEIARVMPGPDLAIEGWYWPAKPGFETIVFFHGNGQDYIHWMQKLAVFREAGYGALHAEYRGYGGNPGKPSEAGLYQDARSYIDWLKDVHDIAPENIVLYGESLGTGVAVQMATEFPVKAIILESPYSSAADVAQAIYPYFPVRLVMMDQYQSISKTKTLDMPKLLIHAVNDEIIPISFARRLYETMGDPKTFITIEGGGHNDLYDHGAALHVLPFLSTITKGPEQSGDNTKE